MNKNYIKHEGSGDRNKNLSVKQYFCKVKSYLRDMIINLQKSATWKIQLTIAINFISFQILYYKCRKISIKHGGSYIDPPDWIKKKRATITPKK